MYQDDKILEAMIDEFDEKWNAFKVGDRPYDEARHLRELTSAIENRIRILMDR